MIAIKIKQKYILRPNDDIKKLARFFKALLIQFLGLKKPTDPT